MWLQQQKSSDKSFAYLVRGLD